MEVNLNPSLNTDTPLDLKIKSMLMTDIYNVIGVEPYSHLASGIINTNYKEKILPNKKLSINEGVSNKNGCFKKISNFLDVLDDDSVTSESNVRILNKREGSKSLQKTLAPLKNINLPKFNNKSIAKNNTNSNLLNLNLKEEINSLNIYGSKRIWNEINTNKIKENESKIISNNDKGKFINNIEF